MTSQTRTRPRNTGKHPDALFSITLLLSRTCFIIAMAAANNQQWSFCFIVHKHECKNNLRFGVKEKLGSGTLMIGIMLEVICLLQVQVPAHPKKENAGSVTVDKAPAHIKKENAGIVTVDKAQAPLTVETAGSLTMDNAVVSPTNVASTAKKMFKRMNLMQVFKSSEPTTLNLGECALGGRRTKI